MKTKKIVALVLSMAMVLGVVAACNKTTESSAASSAATDATTAGTDATDATDAPVESTEAPAEEGNFKQLDVVDPATLTDEGDLLVWSWNEEIGNNITKYYTGKNFDMTKSENYATTPNTGGAYRQALALVLSTGEGAPDVYGTEADYIQAFMNSESALALADLGISNAELESTMYNYTLQIAADSSKVIRGVSWQANPAGVWYNRAVAEKYLGVSDPDGVGAYFSSWDKFIETAKKIDADSNHAVKAVASIADVARPYLNTRTQGWVVNGKLTIDPQVEAYLDFGKQLFTENLTFNAAQWSDAAWTDGPQNETVLSYFGPMWLGRFSLGLCDENAQPTKDLWGITAAPNPYYWGGSWLSASPYCDVKASAAQIMRDVCMSEATLSQMVKGAEFVNNINIIKATAADANFGFAFLDGQNPYTMLAPIADGIDASTITAYDGDIGDTFNNLAEGYFDGTTGTVAEVESALEAAVAEII